MRLLNTILIMAWSAWNTFANFVAKYSSYPRAMQQIAMDCARNKAVLAEFKQILDAFDAQTAEIFIFGAEPGDPQHAQLTKLGQETAAAIFSDIRNIIKDLENKYEV